MTSYSTDCANLMKIYQLIGIIEGLLISIGVSLLVFSVDLFRKMR